MGSPDAFERRREELVRLHGAASDDDVVRSYQEFALPHGPLGRYLRAARLGEQVGRVLFVHGALPLPDGDDPRGPDPRGPLVLPWRGEGVAAPDLDSWLAALEDLRRGALDDWERTAARGAPAWSAQGGYAFQRSERNRGHDLMQYGMGRLPDGRKNPTVAYSQWLDAEGRPEMSPVRQAALREFFRESRTELVVTGHKPVGDLPLPIKLEVDGNTRTVLMADNSYAGDVRWADASGKRGLGRGAQNRGRGEAAVSEVIVQQNHEGGVVSVLARGVLSDGSEYSSADLTENTLHDHIGRPLDPKALRLRGEKEAQDRRWWVRCRLEDGRYVVSKAQGFDVLNALAEER